MPDNVLEVAEDYDLLLLNKFSYAVKQKMRCRDLTPNQPQTTHGSHKQLLVARHSPDSCVEISVARFKSAGEP